MQTPGRTPGIKRVCCVIVAALMMLLSAGTVKAQSPAKSVEGRVLSASGVAVPGAIIYLQDEKTNIIKTFIATADGSYRFGQLPAGTDYVMWAEYKGEKTKKRAISSFDTKLDVTYDFHLK